jgi:predicted amidohydrolase YtcJ
MSTADTVLFNGHLITMDEARPTAVAIAVRGDRLLAVGSDAEIMATADRGTQTIDLRGRTVVPGLIDAHTHLELTAVARHHWTDVRSLNVEQVLSVIRALAGVRPAGEWIVLQGTFGQALPDRAALDAVAPEHPVAVRWSMHKFQLNGSGLEAAGIGPRSIAPPGTRIHFGTDGQPTGLIEEGWDLVGWPAPLLEPLRESIAETAKSLFLCHGVTTIHDVAASGTGMAAYLELAESKEVLPRIGLALTAAPGHQPLISASSFARTGLRTGFGGPQLRLSAMKIFLDGGRDGALRSTGMSEVAGRWGVLTRTPQQLAEELTAAVGAGLQTWIHAIGDLAQEIAVSAIEQAVRAHPGLDHRTRIEHFGNELYDRERLDRLIAAGGIAVPNPSFIFAEPDDPERRLPPGVVKYGLRTLLDAGARPPGNSDTAGGQPFACNPWFTMQSMVQRTNKNGCVIDPDQRLSVAQALRCFTVDAARATFCEHDRGALIAGKLADLAVLNVDPFQLAGSELASVTSELTMVGGRIAAADGVARL